MKTIGVFAPSSYIEKDDIDTAAAVVKAYGLDVFVHPQTYARYNQSAGTQAEKLAALHDLYRDDLIDIIWAAGGGNRALHIVDDIDYDFIAAHPKPMVGFSDVTALLNAITAKTGIINYHGPVFKSLPQHQELEAFLSGDFTMPLGDAKIINAGHAEGTLFGGNLSLFQYLPQTIKGDWPDGAILFLEDCNEELSRIDRMLLHLKRLGVFARAAGLVFGQFTDLQDSTRPFGFSLEDIIREHTCGLDIPIIMNAPFGHGAQNVPFAIGASAHLHADKAAVTLTCQG
ncbi:MAG: S66 peptidase family protein [Bdellovibrionales bacterium]